MSTYIGTPDIPAGLTIPAYRRSRTRKLSAIRRILGRIL